MLFCNFFIGKIKFKYINNDNKLIFIVFIDVPWDKLLLISSFHSHPLPMRVEPKSWWGLNLTETN